MEGKTLLEHIQEKRWELFGRGILSYISEIHDDIEYIEEGAEYI